MLAIRKLKHWLLRQSTSWYLNTPFREVLPRQLFFANAFKAISFNGISGDYTEFGCHGGRTFAMAYHEAVRHNHGAHLWAFDSFRGLPGSSGEKDAHPVWVEGKLSTSIDSFHEWCTIRSVPEEKYTVVPGFYDTTLRAMAEDDEPTNIALAYIDCDLYSSTIEVLRFLDPRIKHGMIIGFDDFYTWSETQIAGERMAMLEFFSRQTKWRAIPYMQFGWSGMSFVIEDANLTQHIFFDKRRTFDRRDPFTVS